MDARDADFKGTLTSISMLSRTLELTLTQPDQQVSFLHACIGSLMGRGAEERGHLIYCDHDGDDVRVLFCGGPLWAIDPHSLVGLTLTEGLPDDAQRLLPIYRQGLSGPVSFEYDFEGGRWETNIAPLGTHSGRQCAHLWFRRSDAR